MSNIHFLITVSIELAGQPKRKQNFSQSVWIQDPANYFIHTVDNWHHSNKGVSVKHKSFSLSPFKSWGIQFLQHCSDWAWELSLKTHIDSFISVVSLSIIWYSLQKQDQYHHFCTIWQSVIFSKWLFPNLLFPILSAFSTELRLRKRWKNIGGNFHDKGWRPAGPFYRQTVPFETKYYWSGSVSAGIKKRCKAILRESGIKNGLSYFCPLSTILLILIWN